MATPLRVLIVEDNASDARLLVERLRDDGFVPQWTRVDAEPDYLAALSPTLDLILADYLMPEFDALRALQLLRERRLDIPFIVVSGAVGEDVAVSALRAGATDYLLKDRLARLGESVRQAIAQRQLKKVHERESKEFVALQQRTRVILDTAADPYIEMDAQGYICDWNAQAEAVFGWTRQEAVGKRLADTIVPPEKRDEHERGLRHFLATGIGPLLGQRIETTAARRDGGRLPVELLVWPIHTRGKVTFTAFVRDMTARKQAEAALVERAQLAAVSADVGLALTQGHSLDEMLRRCAQSMVDNLGAAFARIWTLSADGQTLELQASAGLCTHIDGRHARVPVGKFKIGLIAQERQPHLTNDVMNDPRVSNQQWARREGMVAFAGYPLLVEERLVGVMAMFARHVLTHAVLDTMAAVANQLALGIERRRSEDSLRESNEKLQSLIHASPLAIVAIDRRRQVLMWNPAAERIFGWTAAEALGQAVPFVDPDDADDFNAMLADEFDGRSRSGVEARRLRKDGKLVDVGLWSAPLRDARGEIVAAMGMHADRTEHKRLEEQYRQAQKMEAIGRLAGGVAHDFNNMLTIILGYADVLRGELSQHDPMAEPVGAIEEAARRAAALTRQLLAFSRKQVLHPTLIELAKVVSGMESMLKRLLGEDISLLVKLQPDVAPVRADVAQIEQVIMNLAINARDAMPDGGQLTIETCNAAIDRDYAATQPGMRAGDYAVLAVSDTGHGMDADTKAHVFEPFFTTKEPGKGTGLGLATIYGIVQQSGGFVTVYSEVGLGATFRVYLPRAMEASPLAETGEPTARIEGGSETILLVEDENDVRRLASSMLRRQGYTVLEAASGGEALQLCERHAGPIDLVVTDVVMPQMNGRQMIDRLRIVRPLVKVLFMSGYTDDAIIRHGAVDQGQPFLQKPFTTKALASMVRQILDARLPTMTATWPASPSAATPG
jgi:PAS domain S-box-containing protein